MTEKQSVKGIETRIENAIMERPEALGYPGAPAIRNCRVPSVTGCPDVILLPQSGPHRFVMVEAKASRAKDAASKVVGQLLMYYAGALTLGSESLQLYVDYAVRNPDSARDTRRTSVTALQRGRGKGDGGSADLLQGSPLRPEEIALFIAVESTPHPSLVPTLRTLNRFHDIRVGLVLVHDGHIEHLLHASG